MKREGLTAITIENFKGISDPVTIPLKPVTLMFGANSAGKSTVIQALQYAWEVLEHNNPDVDQTTLGGEVINLGGFQNLVHKHDLSKSISIMFHFRGNICNEAYYADFIDGEGFFFWDPKDEDGEAYSIDVNEWIDINDFAIKVISSWDCHASSAYISKYEVYFGGKPFGYISTDDNKCALLEINGNHPFFSREAFLRYDKKNLHFFEAIKDTLLSDFHKFQCSDKKPGSNMLPVFIHAYKKIWELQGKFNKKDFAIFLKSSIKRLLELDIPDFEEAENVAISDLLSHDSPKKNVLSVIPKWGKLLHVSDLDCEGPINDIGSLNISTDLLQDKDNVNRSDPKDMSDKTMILCFLSQLMIGPGEAILNQLREMRYTGPLRKIPGREYRPPNRPDRSRWADGQGAWDALLRAEPGDSLVTKCSEYISSTLKLGYTLAREDRVYINMNGDLATMLQGDDVSTRNEAIKRMLAQPKIPFIQLHDMRAGVPVEALDVGVGVSQVLPVVVGAVEPNCSMFIVEQPELHIHPAVQTNLGDVFLRELLEEGAKPRVFLLETHSEHLVLRIMRRMRETYEDRLPDGFPPVTPDDVAIILFESIEGRTYVREMPLNKHGELVKAWPGGFFEEALWETL